MFRTAATIHLKFQRYLNVKLLLKMLDHLNLIQMYLREY
jgi:hypothetical protein